MILPCAATSSSQWLPVLYDWVSSILSMSSQHSKNTSASCKRHSTDTFGTNGGVVSLAKIWHVIIFQVISHVTQSIEGIWISGDFNLIFFSTHHTRHVLTWSPRSIRIRARGLNWASRLSTSLTWATRSSTHSFVFFLESSPQFDLVNPDRSRSLLFQTRSRSLTWCT